MERLRFESELADLGVVERDQPPPRPDVVCIALIDPSGVFKDKRELINEFKSKLADKFNNLDPKWLKDFGFKFIVIYRASEPSDKEKAGFKELDFPVYLLSRQHEEKSVRKLMEQHKIPEKVYTTDIYDVAVKAWATDHIRGVGIPPGTGYRKVAFIKTHKVFEDPAGNNALAFVNVTAHEIGHMGNITKHAKTGLMKYPVPLNAEIDFNEMNKKSFLGNLARLRALRDKKLKK